VAAERYDLPDLDELAVELVQLRHLRADGQRRLDGIACRMAAFPNELGLAQQAALESELAAMEQRMLQIEAQLLPLRRVR
jgi:hypothetical protein